MPRETKPFEWTTMRLIKRGRILQERFQAKRRKEMLLDLANLPNDSCERFRKRFFKPNRFRKRFFELNPRFKGKNPFFQSKGIPFPSQWRDNALLELRDELQTLWRGEGLPGQSIQDSDIAFKWLHKLNRRGPIWSVTYNMAEGLLFFQPDWEIPLPSVAIGVSEWGSKMAVCANPDCPQKYFLKGRKTQQFCDRPACSEYGQRAHKRKWWSEHGKQRERKG